MAGSESKGVVDVDSVGEIQAASQGCMRPSIGEVAHALPLMREVAPALPSIGGIAPALGDFGPNLTTNAAAGRESGGARGSAMPRGQSPSGPTGTPRANNAGSRDPRGKTNDVKPGKATLQTESDGSVGRGMTSGQTTLGRATFSDPSENHTRRRKSPHGLQKTHRHGPFLLPEEETTSGSAKNSTKNRQKFSLSNSAVAPETASTNFTTVTKGTISELQIRNEFTPEFDAIKKRASRDQVSHFLCPSCLFTGVVFLLFVILFLFGVVIGYVVVRATKCQEACK